MFKFLGIALLLLVTAMLLKSFGWRGAPIFAAIGAQLLLSEAVAGIASILESDVFFGLGYDIEKPIRAALKILGLGYLFGIVSDICRELGESGIAKAVEVVGRVEIIAVTLPFFEEIIRVGVGLIK